MLVKIIIIARESHCHRLHIILYTIVWTHGILRLYHLNIVDLSQNFTLVKSMFYLIY